MLRTAASRSTIAALSALLIACSGATSDPSPDGSTSAVDGGIPAPVAPEAPAPAALSPVSCPGGWVAYEAAGRAVACVPSWLTSDAVPPCAADEARFPSSTACEPIGATCPAGDFADDLPAGGTVVFVRAGAEPGDGSRDRPYDSIARALAMAPTGSTIALAKGTYDQGVSIARSMTIVGACPAETIWTASTPSLSRGGIVEVTGGDVTIRDVRFTPSPFAAVIAQGGRATVRLESVRIDGASGAGIVVNAGARLSATRLAVRDTRDNGGIGTAIGVMEGGSATVERAVLERSLELSVAVWGGEATLTDVAIRGTTALTAAGGPAIGFEGGTVRVVASVVEDNVGSAIVADTAASALELESVIVRNTTPHPGGMASAVTINRGATARIVRSALFATQTGASAVGASRLEIADSLIAGDPGDDPWGYGVLLGEGSTALIARSHVHAAMWAGIAATGAGTTASIEDVAVTDTAGDAELGLGRAIEVSEGAQITGARLDLERNRDIAVAVMEPGSGATLEDVAIRDTEPARDGTRGSAVAVQDGAFVVVARGLVERSHESGITCAGAGTVAQLEDVTIVDTQPSAALPGELGIAFAAADGCVASIRRGLFERNRDTALWAHSEGTSLEIEDVRVSDTASSDDELSHGVALMAQFGARTEVTRAVFELSRARAVLIVGAHGTLRDVRITDVVPPKCAETGCPLGEGVVGAAAFYGGVLDMERFEVRRSDLCGVQVALDGQLALRDGVIAESRIGACVQVDGYDLARLTDRVRFEDNDVTIDTTTLELPQPRELPIGPATPSAP